MSKRLLRLLAVLLAFTLVAPAGGGDDDDESSGSASASEPAASGSASASASEPASEDDGGEMAEGVVEFAAGTSVDIAECPEDWSDTTGVDGDEIRIGWTGPQSGQLAAFGAIGDGMQMYFDYINETDPIDGKEIVLITRDDAYESGRAVANVEEMLETEDIFMFAHTIGTPINLAVRPITDEACVPQIFNSSGFPFWGDPANFPWTVGNILNYVTETQIWCQAIVDEFGQGATVAALIMDNDFGKTYQNELQNCAAAGQIDLVAEANHDPAAPDVTNEMTTLIGSGADVFIAGTTAAFCPQAVGTVAASDYRPRFYMSYTCNNLASFFTPVQDAAGLLAAEGAGVRMANQTKICGDPTFAEDPAILLMEEILDTYGGVTCADGSFSTGIIYGEMVVTALREAVAAGPLTRTDFMSALWNISTTSPYQLGGTLALDGVNDA
ncbi:MAG: ABC transporter substrate-binding protein, partial [Actinomycetota bacterium]